MSSLKSCIKESIWGKYPCNSLHILQEMNDINYLLEHINKNSKKMTFMDYYKMNIFQSISIKNKSNQY